MTQLPPWVGHLELETGAGALLELGALQVWVMRGAREWRLAHVLSRDTERREARLVREVAEPPAGSELQRWGFGRDVHSMRLRPALADRPVVIRPDVPLTVSAGVEITLYVGTPVWLQIEGGGFDLLDVPSYRLSDTWFGPNTIRGEICYATRTLARLDPGELEPRGNRVIVPVAISNTAATPLAVKSLKLPLAFLEPFADAHGRLWAPTVRVIRDSEEADPEVRVDGAPPREAGKCVSAGNPRARADRGFLGRAFGALA